MDNRPLPAPKRSELVIGKPEVRKYVAIFVIKDAETGDTSDEAAVTAQV